MRRDPELVRKLLFYFEEKSGYEAEESPNIEGYDRLDIMYHMLMLAQAGFLDHEPTRSTTSERIIQVLGFGLTWEGHEFLEAARDDSLWQRAKQQTFSVAGGIAFDLLKAWLMNEAKKKLFLAE